MDNLNLPGLIEHEDQEPHLSYDAPQFGPHNERTIVYKTCLPLEVDEAIGRKLSKYLDLVWYARKGAPDDEEYWKDTPEHIKKGAFNAMAKVEELYPDETDALKCFDTGNWEHGFNSGCLAAFRYIVDACDRSDWSKLYEEDPSYDPENPTTHDPLKYAEENFPELDT